MGWKITLAVVALAIHAPGAAAQDYPVRAIRVLHGFGVGGPPDVAARRIAGRLEQRLGVPVVVENRPGASGTIAASAVAHAAADGHTLLFGVAANLAVAPATMSPAPYDPGRAFAPIVEVARGPYVWLVRADAGMDSMAAFIGRARREPGKLNYASPGNASVHHMATEMLKRAAAIDIVHVPYTTSLYTALLGGQVDAMFESMPGPLPHLASGKLRALAVTGTRRLPVLPDVPTLDELGITGVEANSWWGFVGPAGLSAAIVAKLNAEIIGVLKERDIQDAFALMAIEPSPGTPAAFGDYIGREYARWRGEAGSLHTSNAIPSRPGDTR